MKPSLPVAARPMRLIVLLVALWLTTPISANGTALFLVWTSKEIVVAADSLGIDADGKHIPEPVCKIGRFGDDYFAASGYVKNARTGYNAYAVLEEASGRSGGLKIRVAAFESLVKVPYEKALTEIRRTNPDFFQRTIKMPLAVSFFGVERGLLVLHSRKFIVNPPSNDEVTSTVVRINCPGEDCIDGEPSIIMTSPDPETTLRFREENADFWKKRGQSPIAARKFVQMHIDAKVPGVGPPIDILRITKNGAEWIKRKPECEEKKTLKPQTHERQRRK